jgi:hypothetical protein
VNKTLVVLILLCAVTSVRAQDTCQVTGTVYLVDGKTPAANARLIVTRADKNGNLYLNSARTYYTNSSGVVVFSVPRTTGTDSSYITVRSDFGNLSAARVIAIPNAATANLGALVTAANYSTSIVAIPGLYIRAGTDSIRVAPYTLQFSDAFQVGQDAYGRPIVRRDPDSVAAGTGVTVTTLRDSMDVEMTSGARLARRISDSLNIIPRTGGATDWTGRPLVSVMDYVWSDTSYSWTTVFQNAIDSARGKILYVPGGVYEFDAQGECPYEAGKQYILDFKTGNTSLWVSPGAALKLNAGLQVDSAVNFIVWRDARDIYIGGGGTITLNASNQSAWVANGGATWASDNGYCQGDAGNIIDGYQTGAGYDASSNITVENLVLRDCFSNPVDIHGATNSVLRNIRAWSFGEGPQFVRGKNVVMDNIFVSDKYELPYWTAGGVGDGIECASCIDFVITNCIIRDYQVTGNIDISYSRGGVISNCVIDSAAALVTAQGPLGNYWADDITVSNCIVTKAGGHVISWTSPGTATFSGITIDSVATNYAGFYVADNKRPVYIKSSVVRHATYGVYTSNGLVEISGCSFDSVAHGVVMGRSAGNEAPVVNITGTHFRNCSIAGVQINAASDATYNARGSVTGSIFQNCVYNPIRFPNAADADSLNFYYQYHDIGGNKLRTNAATWGTDSAVIANKGYVDTRLGSYATTAALTDSLNGVIRPGALTSALSTYATTAALSDTASARALAVGDSLLAMRGTIRSAIADTLVKYSYGIMRGDSAALTAVLDMIYPRSGGGVSVSVLSDSLDANPRGGGGATVDTARLMPGFTNQDLSYSGHIKVKSAAADTVASFWNLGQSTVAIYRDGSYRGLSFAGGSRIVERTTTGNFRFLFSNVLQMYGGRLQLSSSLSTEGDSLLTVGDIDSKGGVHVFGGGYFHGDLGLGRIRTNGVRLDVAGRATVTDTLRVGDYTAFTYIIPGGDPVKSSTGDIKTDISAIETPQDFAARVLAVSPKRYRFKPGAYLRGISDTLVGKERTDALAADAAQAAKQSERVMTGFIAEEFNPAFSSRPDSKEIDSGEIMAALWKANQELLRRVADLEARVKKLEGR